MSHNFRTLHEANEFVRKHGYDALDAEDAARIKELKESRRHMVDIIESGPSAIRRQIQTVSEAIGPIRRLKISESERFSRINAAEQEIKRLEKKLTAVDDKQLKDNLIACGFSEAAAQAVVDDADELSEGNDSLFNSWKLEALHQGKTEEEAIRYANIMLGNETEGSSTDRRSREDANYIGFLGGL